MSLDRPQGFAAGSPSAGGNRLPRLGSRLSSQRCLPSLIERNLLGMFSETELRLLREAAAEHGLSQASLHRLLELEASFQGMGRRRGLFPAMRQLVEELAADLPHAAQVGESSK